MTASKDAIVARAKAYPFAPPAQSYVLVGHRSVPLTDSSEEALAKAVRAGGGDPGRLAKPRTAVIAWGSNASPTRLAEKFGDFRADAVIPVLRSELRDFAVVHSAHLSAYGSVPATGRRAPGARAKVFVALLTDAQLDRLHSTEAIGRNYGFYRLDGLRLAFEGGGESDAAHAYLSLHGCLDVDGDCVALAAVEAEAVPFRTLDQIAVLSLVRDRLAPGSPLDDFIHETVTDEGLRARRIAVLRESASPSPASDGLATRIL